MPASSVFTLNNTIRLMIFIGLAAVLFVTLKSCQQPKTGLEQFRAGPLSRLEVLETPPAQPRQIFGTSDERALQLSELHGKIVLMNVWASWCPPCVAEMPMLDRLQADMGDDRFQVVTISLDRTAEEADAFFERNGIQALTPWHGPIDLAAKVGAPGLPITIFYDRQGRELARLSGEVDWDKATARAFIQHLLES